MLEVAPDEVEEASTWSLQASLWGRRNEEAGGDYFDNPQHDRQADASDLKNLIQFGLGVFLSTELDKWLNNTAEMERHMLSRQHSAQSEANRIYKLLKPHMEQIRRLFQFYICTNNVDPPEKAELANPGTPTMLQMRKDDYMRFVWDAGIVDEASKYVTSESMGRFFDSANFEFNPMLKNPYATNKQKDDLNKYTSDINSANADDAMMRFEFMEVIVRLSVMKFGRGQRIWGPMSKCVEMMLYEHIMALYDSKPVTNPAMHQVSEPAMHHAPASNEFRVARLYTEPVDEWFTRRMSFLRAWYELHCFDVAGNEAKGLRLVANEGQGRTPMLPRGMAGMSLGGWMTLLRKLHLIGEDEDYLGSERRRWILQGFTPDHARWIFFASRLRHVEEKDDATCGYVLTFVDFTEALGRVADSLAWPRTEELEELNLPSVGAYIHAAWERSETQLVDAEMRTRPKSASMHVVPSYTRLLNEKLTALLEICDEYTPALRAATTGSFSP
mmetsp:Transcript_30035/g.97789  ORF Transcript_30035/g.97789 Transcript_30035/m.97789 type:complete len:500 (+) Transcript_30035:2-1501(+)